MCAQSETADFGAEEGSAPFVETHGTNYRQTGVFLEGKERATEFFEVGHGFYDRSVEPDFFGDFRLFGEDGVGVLEGQPAVGFHQFPYRTAVVQNVLGVGFPRRFCRAFYKVGKRISLVGFFSVTVKGVGVNDVASRLDVGGVDFRQNVGVGHVEVLRRRNKSPFYKFRPRSAVEVNSAFIEKFAKIQFLLLTPAIAITDLLGVNIKLSFIYIPALRASSRS